jgi:hypothetical protein
MSLANTTTNNQAEDDDDSIQGEESNQSCEDEDVSNHTSNKIATVRAAMVAGTTNTMSALVASMLDEAPTTIEDHFSSVLGDSFHFMDRPKVPMHHDGKKGYFVAPRQAWFQWDPTKLAEVKATLRYERGMNNNEIEALMYYNVDYFRVRVPRVVLPPSKLYWRVRAVYEMYGPMTDAKTKAPLFNKAAWKKANNVLKEILAGNASDPCGMVFYTQQLNAKGEPPLTITMQCLTVAVDQMTRSVPINNSLQHLGRGIREYKCQTFLWQNGAIDTTSMFWSDFLE